MVIIMRFKVIVPIILAIVLGVFMSKFMYKQYDYSINLKTVFGGNVNKAYFIEYGVFPSYDDMQKGVINLSSYIYEIINNNYYVYGGITKSRDNSLKLKGFFEKNGYNIYIKEIAIEDDDFLEKLYEFDELLSRTSDDGAIKAICNQVLAKYEEMVISRV